jgi:hypothetical protein
MSVNVGNEICVAGYIMDTYCIERGTLLDNPSIKTLSADGPLKHSVHCLVDVARCNSSPFEVLIQVENDTNSWERAWRVNDNSAILEHARSVGKCSTCTNTATDAIESGYRITIKGEVKDLGAGDVPPTISISSIGDYENYDTICDRSGVVTFPSEEPSPNPTVTEDGGDNTDVDMVDDTSSTTPPSLAPSTSSKSEEPSSADSGGFDASPSEEPSPNPTVTEDDGDNKNDIDLLPSLAPSISSENEEPSSNPTLRERNGNRVISASKIAGIGPLSLGCLLLIPVIVAMV